MQRSQLCAWMASVGLALTGCSSEATSGSASSDGSASALQEQAGTDARCPCEPGAQPPLGSAEIAVVGNGPFDMVGTAFTGVHGEITAVYESYTDDYMSSAWLSAATSADCGKTFSAPTRLALGSAANYQTTPSAVRLGHRRYLYFASADDFGSPPTLSRSEFEAGRFGEAEPVGSISGVSSLLSWPRFIEAPLGVAVAFRTTPDKLASFAWSLGGLAFAPPSTVNPARSAMPRTAFFRSGAAVFTYQTVSADLVRYWSWWRISTDGKTWTDPALVSTSAENVQDTAPFLRSDGDIDLYYIYSSLEPTDTFRLYRRSLTRNGALGPEELVTSAGSPNKPNLERLPGGKVLLLYSDITQADADGYPLVQVFKAAVLAGDAPRP